MAPDHTLDYYLHFQGEFLNLNSLLWLLNFPEKMHAQALLTATGEITIAQQRNDAHELVQLEETLAPSEDDKLRYIPLTALITQSQVLGWNKARISRLNAFRNDASIMVAEKAQFTFLPDTSV